MVQRGTLRFTDVQLAGRNLPIESQRDTIRILPPRDGTLEISFEGVFKPPSRSRAEEQLIRPSVIDDRNVVLLGTWYPKVDQPCQYQLMVILPDGFEAVSEAERIEKKVAEGNAAFTFHFLYPLREISLIASKRYKVSRGRSGNVDILTYFFTEDEQLAANYIEQTKKYLKLYEGLIGPFPYKRFSIVENPFPTGYSMPTFTLLGQNVVRLPFITETSLGHEIVHQWFGGAVEVDPERGNWAEGLATYLADHLYQEEKGGGAAYRKGLLTEYQSYANRENEYPLSQFSGRSDSLSKAIGYDKAAMVFHMLRKGMGDEPFCRGLRYFVTSERNKMAGWQEIRKAFEKESGKSLNSYFTQWVRDKGLPELSLEDVDVRQRENKWEVQFTIAQKGKPYILDVPVTLYWKGGRTTSWFHLDEEREKITMRAEGPPDRISVDEEYNVARRLSREEFAPVISRLLGSDKLLIVVPHQGTGMYKEVADAFSQRGGRRIEGDALTDADMRENSLVVLGADNTLVTRLYGKLKDDAGFSVTVKENPRNPARVIAIVQADSQEEVDKAHRRIIHYGRYSYVAFRQGKNTARRLDETRNGISKEFSVYQGLDQTTLKTVNSLFDAAAGKKIIYVGEVHDRFSHHLVQLEIVKGLVRKGRKVAIGMEMFQRSAQRALDDYVAGRSSERQLLKESQYFKRWGFDYNLYRPILDFARSERIPVIALNLQQEVVGKVSQGGLESLSVDEKKMIPAQLDFSDQPYKERVRKIYREHEASKDRPFDFFYQAQILWDETMAESVDIFLKRNPEYQVVVLAGNGHLSYGSGIPARAARRNGYDYAIILNESEIEKGIADYVLSPQPVSCQAMPKLMVTLAPPPERLAIQSFPEESISQKAGMKAGDVLTAFNDTPIASIEDLRLELIMHKKGDKVRVKVLRRQFFGREREIEFDLIL
jgi:aminopeptidase N